MIWCIEIYMVCKFIYLKIFYNLFLVCLLYNFNFYKNVLYYSLDGFIYKYFGKIVKFNI